MKKVLAQTTKYVFGTFGIAILGLLMSLTFQALGHIFPNSFINQMWGLVLYDIAAMCWALAFVYGSETVTQYAVSAIGFLVGFIGTLGMVAAEVMLGGQTMVTTDTAQIGQWIVYSFIVATALHAILLYAHHGGGQEIKQRIDVGIARGEITTEAIKQATATLDVERGRLAESITREIVDQVKRDLNIPILANNTIFDPNSYQAVTPASRPIEAQVTKDEAIQPSNPLVKATNKLIASFRSLASDAKKNGANANVDAENGLSQQSATEKPQLTQPIENENPAVYVTKRCSYCTNKALGTEQDLREAGWVWKIDTNGKEIALCPQGTKAEKENFIAIPYL